MSNTTLLNEQTSHEPSRRAYLGVRAAIFIVVITMEATRRGGKDGHAWTREAGPLCRKLIPCRRGKCGGLVTSARDHPTTTCPDDDAATPRRTPISQHQKTSNFCLALKSLRRRRRQGFMFHDELNDTNSRSGSANENERPRTATTAVRAGTCKRCGNSSQATKPEVGS